MADENAHPLESRVPLPEDLVASARLLLRTKQTFRDKDAEDRMFLEAKIARESK